MNILVAVGFILALPNLHWCMSVVDNGSNSKKFLYDIFEADVDRDEKDDNLDAEEKDDHPDEEEKDDHPTMPNIGYLFRGYNIMFGNPLPTDGGMDPGFRQPIFKAVYKSHKLTPDNRYLQPDGTSIQDCGGSCSMSFQTKEISNAKSYQESLENKVSASIGASYAGFSAAFSASASFKEVEERTSKKSSRFTQSSATCCSYLSQLLNYEKPPLTGNFINALLVLNKLPTEFAKSQKEYFKFIQTFGTHYIREATLGALFGQQSEISEDEWTRMKESGRKISAEAEASGFGVAVSAGYMNDKQKKRAAQFAKSTTNQKKFTIGAPPPPDGKVETWVQDVHSSPAPMSLKIGPISDIFDLSNLPKVVKDNMKKALLGYCNWLATAQKHRTIIKSCSAPKSNNVTLETKKFFQILYTSPKKGCLSMWNTKKNADQTKKMHVYEQLKAEYDFDHENYASKDLNLELCKQLCSTSVYCRSIDYIEKTKKSGKSACFLSKENKLTKPSLYQSPCTLCRTPVHCTQCTSVCQGDKEDEEFFANAVYLEKKSLHISYTSKVKGCLSKSADWIYNDIETLEQCKQLCSTFWDCRSVDYLPTKTREQKWKKMCYLHKHTRLTMPQKFKEPCNDHWWSMEHVEKQNLGF